MFTNDIVGSSLGQNGVRDPNSVRLFAVGPYFDETPQEAADRRTTGSENDSPARQLARYAKDVPDQAPTDMSVRIVYKRDRYLRGGDHIPFLDRRYPAARFTEVNEDHRHQHQNVRVEDGTQFGDLLDFVDFGYMTRVAKVNAATLAGLASAPGTMSGVRVHTGQLSVDTDLEWDPSPEADLAGYEIVYRDTIQPYGPTRSACPRTPCATSSRASRRTTTCSACAPSTPTATAARLRSPSRSNDLRRPAPRERRARYGPPMKS